MLLVFTCGDSSTLGRQLKYGCLKMSWVGLREDTLFKHSIDSHGMCLSEVGFLYLYTLAFEILAGFGRPPLIGFQKEVLLFWERRFSKLHREKHLAQVEASAAMPFDTVNEQYVRQRKVLVCERCRRPMDGVQNRQAYQTGREQSSSTQSLGATSLGMSFKNAILQDLRCFHSYGRRFLP